MERISTTLLFLLLSFGNSFAQDASYSYEIEVGNVFVTADVKIVSEVIRSFDPDMTLSHSENGGFFKARSYHYIVSQQLSNALSQYGYSLSHMNVSSQGIVQAQKYSLIIQNEIGQQGAPPPPVNDDPCNAIALTVNTSCITTQYSNATATATAGVPVPGCANYQGGDVWFTATVPGDGNLNLESEKVSGPNGVSDGGMAVYTSATCAGPFTEVGCDADSNTGGNGNMPLLNLTGLTPGSTVYIRFWEEGNNNNGNFDLCAWGIALPPDCQGVPGGPDIPGAPCDDGNVNTVNDIYQPDCSCLGSLLDCLGVLGGAAVPGTTCNDGDPNTGNDVYQSDCTCAGELIDCLGVAGGPALPGTICDDGDPNTIGDVYQANCTCAGSSFDCSYTLNLFDSYGDGWDGSFITVIINGTSYGPYTVNFATTILTIGVNIGDLIQISYTSGGGIYENEISYELILSGGILFSDGPDPSTGPSYAGIVDCIPPPASAQDCIGGITICSDQTLNGNSGGTGAVADLDPGNEGCLLSDEQQGTWYYFSPSASGTIGMTISPQVSADDYDFAIWGPSTGISCPPPGPPLRCSYAAPGGDTGMNGTATDTGEPASGDKWVSDIDVLVGEVYVMYIDNWSTSGEPFDLTWQLSNGASLACTVLPVEMISFTVDNLEVANRLNWSTATETNTDQFIVERATTELDFIEIGHIAAAGQSNNPVQYQYLDGSPVFGLNYYRLKQTDIDGNFSYSNILTAWNENGGINISDPIIDHEGQNLSFYINSSTESMIRMELFDITGRIVHSNSTFIYSGSNNIQFNYDRPAHGTYIFRLSDEKGGILKTGPIQLTPVSR